MATPNTVIPLGKCLYSSPMRIEKLSSILNNDLSEDNSQTSFCSTNEKVATKSPMNLDVFCQEPSLIERTGISKNSTLASKCKSFLEYEEGTTGIVTEREG